MAVIVCLLFGVNKAIVGEDLLANLGGIFFCLLVVCAPSIRINKNSYKICKIHKYI